MSVSAPFDLPGDDRGVLLIHGFTGAPEGLRYLGEQLAARGVTVRAPLLPGHGTRVEDLEHVTWHDWADHVVAEYDALAARCRTVAVVGQSMGGVLALHVGLERAATVGAVATLAAPLWIAGLAAQVTRWTAPGAWLAGRLRFVPKIGGPDVRSPEAKRGYHGYSKVSIAALHQLMALIDAVAARLEAVRAPVLVLHGKDDHTVPVACAPALAARTRAERLRILDRSFHLLASDVERDVVAAEVGAFVDRHLAPHQRSA
jgi:carboxylesterase